MKTVDPQTKKVKVNLIQLRKDFLTMVENMNNNSVFDITNFTRTVSPFFKTSKLGTIFHLRARYSNKCVRCEVLPFTSNGLYIIEVVTSLDHDAIVYTFFCESHKHLLLKLIKHDLV